MHNQTVKDYFYFECCDSDLIIVQLLPKVIKIIKYYDFKEVFLLNKCCIFK